MKIASFIVNGTQRFGIVREHSIVDLTNKVEANSVRELLEQGALDQLESLVRDAPADFSLDDVQLLPPVPGAWQDYLCGGEL